MNSFAIGAGIVLGVSIFVVSLFSAYEWGEGNGRQKGYDKGYRDGINADNKVRAEAMAEDMAAGLRKK